MQGCNLCLNKKLEIATHNHIKQKCETHFQMHTFSQTFTGELRGLLIFQLKCCKLLKRGVVVLRKPIVKKNVLSNVLRINLHL